MYCRWVCHPAGEAAVAAVVGVAEEAGTWSADLLAAAAVGVALSAVAAAAAVLAAAAAVESAAPALVVAAEVETAAVVAACCCVLGHVEDSIGTPLLQAERRLPHLLCQDGFSGSVRNVPP